MRALLLCAALVALVACAGREAKPGREGEVGLSMVALPGDERLALAENERFEYPLPDPANRFPEYPQERLADALEPVVVCVALSVGTDGEVFRIDPVEAGEDCEATREAPQAFREAVFDALGFWRYEPAFRCVYPEGVQPGALGCIEPAEIVPVAVRLPYRFVFEQREGRGVVGAQ